MFCRLYFLLFFLFCTNVLHPKDIEYTLSSESEDYSMRYFFCSQHSCFIGDTITIDRILPSSFVIELNSLREYEKVTISHGIKDLTIEKKRNRYYIGRRSCSLLEGTDNLLSLYYVNNKIIIYVDNKELYRKRIALHIGNAIVIKWNKLGSVEGNRFVRCYQPVPFNEYNYGKVLEKELLNGYNPFKIIPENVGADYSLSLSSATTINSLSSLRFEYRFSDSKENEQNKTGKARSEISGIYSNSPISKWIVEFDFFVPLNTKDDPDDFEIITQIHEGCKISTTPSFFLYMLNGTLNYSLRGDSTFIEEWRAESPVYREKSAIAYVEKDKWHHIKIYLKEGWQYNYHPMTKIWIDNKLLVESKSPNSYCYIPAKQGCYNFVKFGIYKPGWVNRKSCEEEVKKRIYFFDNVIVKN